MIPGTQYDVVIVGGGPAGLSAAMLLGRARRRVVVFDSGKPRNVLSQGMHGYLSRDGILPAHFLNLGRGELSEYGIDYCAEEVIRICPAGRGFIAFTAREEGYPSRKVLIATGLVDRLPGIRGAAQLFGRGVFHCPYCDGWEVRDQPIAVMGRRRAALELAVSLKQWSQDVTLLAYGGGRLQEGEHRVLAKHGVKVQEGPVAGLRESGGVLSGVEFRDGSVMICRALFISFGYDQHSSLAKELGCTFTRQGVVRTDRYQQTSTPGVYVAGDAAHDMQMVAVAAAEGAKAGVAINKAFLAEDL